MTSVVKGGDSSAGAGIRRIAEKGAAPGKTIESWPAYAGRKAVLQKLADQTVLVDIAKNGIDMNVRVAAVEKLTGQALLAKIAEKDPCSKTLTKHDRDNDFDYEVTEYSLREAAAQRLRGRSGQGRRLP